MAYDVTVIGAGIGGLMCAAMLAKGGKRVVLLEKDRHIGGTSYIFRRGGYVFPMGPLSFSYPSLVQKLLDQAGIETEITFTRNHFQLITPFVDIIYSRPFEEFKGMLHTVFPQEQGIDPLFAEMEGIIALVRDVYRWHPDYLSRCERERMPANTKGDFLSMVERVRAYSGTSCSTMLDRYLSDPFLKRLLGSQGTYEPVVSVLKLASMWNLMSWEGIWFPSCGIHGICDLLRDAFDRHGGEMHTGAPVEEILIRDGRAVGVRTAGGRVFESRWVVSNVDYKRTFLDLLDERDAQAAFLERIKGVPYTGSELCVYLGIDPKEIDLCRLRATHVFYRHRLDPEAESGPEDFSNREIEICLWSDNAPDLVPSGKASMVLRVDLPYEHVAGFRTGEKRRGGGYREYKERLAQSLIRTVEGIIPGLGTAIETIEIATPLTYEDWGHRYRGSIAGWSWSMEHEGMLGGKILVHTPVGHLLMVGIYAVSELFLGGVPSAMHTACLASDIILGNAA
ncbi:MAG: phytoene desaturase family protein [bacterium]